MAALTFAPAMMPSGDCFTTIHPNQPTAPARMEDGRLFTDYRPRCAQYPVKVTGRWGEHDGRQKMIQTSDMLMEEARNLLQKKAAAVKDSTVDTMVPEVYKRVCTWRGCETVPGHYAGIGTGRIYIPNAASAADDADGLARATIPTMRNTFSMEGPPTASVCAADDKEKLWKFLDQPAGYSARATPYSGPRA
jgi:hypothetical protein